MGTSAILRLIATYALSWPSSVSLPAQ